MKIAVAGLGYVGLSLSTLLSLNNEVISVDIDAKKVELVNKRIGTAKMPSLFYIRINSNCRKIIKGDIAGEFVNPNIAESVKGKIRFVGLISVLTNIFKHCFGGAVVFRIKIPVFIKNFRKRKGNPVAGF